MSDLQEDWITQVPVYRIPAGSAVAHEVAFAYKETLPICRRYIVVDTDNKFFGNCHICDNQTLHSVDNDGTVICLECGSDDTISHLSDWSDLGSTLWSDVRAGRATWYGLDNTSTEWPRASAS